LFETGTVNDDGSMLLMEIGPDYCCYGFFNEAGKSFLQIRFISFDEQEADKEMENILSEIAVKPGKVIISSAFAEALVCPGSFAQSDDAIHKVIYQEAGHKILYDKVKEWQMDTVYSLPASLFSIIERKLPGAGFCHAYTSSLKIYNGFVAPDQIDIHFTTNYFRVIVKKESLLQLAQTYHYKTPLDVIYYLLKITYEFQLDQSETFVIVSGLVEQESALYQELHNYFVNIHFAQAPSYELPGDDYPHYYFNSLYNLAACGS
jgi:hypothetical protein